jgi:phenylalanyl-tRNA synthetase alpha chain
MSTDLASLESDLICQIAQADTLNALDAVRVAAIGKKGSLSEILKTLGTLSVEEKRTLGAAVNATRDRVSEALQDRKEALESVAFADRLAAERMDVTLPCASPQEARGRIHPIYQVIEEITAIFAGMGFRVADGPDIETDFHNFTALNFPEGHPAREMHDTFFLRADSHGKRKVLRTHTSPVQIRTMLTHTPPIRVICPGRTYRCDSDQTHTPMFHQVEGLVIEKGAHMGHLKWVLETFCRAFFEVESLNMRFRPSFFPFTEPSMEVDIQCDRSSSAIRFGTGSDWLEVLGCGMVHPNVLRNGGINPDEYQGFAWGMGIDRLAMLKYGISDLRAFFDADTRWLTHYGFRALDVPSKGAGLSQSLS